MSECATLIAGATAGVGPTLQAVDCMSGHVTEGAFQHLLGPQGVFMPALIAALTIYVAMFGFMLLSGRAQLGLGIGRRMLALGFVLTFATSWAAYGPIVWQLATRAPDDVAGAILGEHGSATAVFATRIDTVFAAVGDATREAAEQETQRAIEVNASGVSTTRTPSPPNQTAGISPATVATAASVILLLATVGVLVTARIVLAVLLLPGPLFVIMALFPATRGLFAGWVRTLTLAAFAPMLVDLSGAFSLELAVPTVARLLGPEGIEANAAMGFFLIATVHATLMVMALRAAGSLVGGWKPLHFGAPTLPNTIPHSAPLMLTLQPRTAASDVRTNSRQLLVSDRNTSRDIRMITTAPRLEPIRSEYNAPRRGGIGSRFRPALQRQVAK